MKVGELTFEAMIRGVKDFLIPLINAEFKAEKIDFYWERSKGWDMSKADKID